MDKLAFIAAQGARNAMSRQDNLSNNMANVNTPGFRAQLMALRSANLKTEGVKPALDSRAFSAETVVGFDDKPGTMQATGNPLDLAIKTKGWFAIQTPNGEAYSRAGSFQVSPEGFLVNSSGFAVLGQDGPIEVPENSVISISDQGLISAKSNDPLNPGVQEIGQIKLVNPDRSQMRRSDDGYFRLNNGQLADQDELVRISSGFIEGSNVNASDMMVQMISAGRSYEMNMKIISTAKENSAKADSLLSGN